MWKSFQKNILVGTITLLPAIVTVYVVQLLFLLIDKFLGQLLSNVLKILKVIKIEDNNIYFLGVYTPFSERIIGIGFILTIIIITSIGAVKRAGNWEYIFVRFDQFFRKIPLISYIYTSVEQLINAFTREHKSFQKVVMVEYPRKGIYTLGFITGGTQGEIKRRTNKVHINVFLPTTPNPTSGWLVIVPEEDVIILNMTVEQALKFIISGGVVTPDDIKEMHDQQSVQEDKEINNNLLNSD